MAVISTSILTVDKKNLVGELYEIEAAKTDYIHIDVMDGKFVPKDTYQQMRDYAKYVGQASVLPLDVHLMVEDVYKGIDYFAALEPDIITFHLETVQKYEMLDVIDYIRSYDCKVRNSNKTRYESRRSLGVLARYTYGACNDSGTGLRRSTAYS